MVITDVAVNVKLKGTMDNKPSYHGFSVIPIIFNQNTARYIRVYELSTTMYNFKICPKANCHNEIFFTIVAWA